jgi:hypothetical protein
MAIPFGTTLISIVRSVLSDIADPYGEDTPYPTPSTFVVATGIRAVVGVPSANPILTIGDRIVYTSKLICDPCDLQESDLVTESSGRIWLALGPTPFGAFAISGQQAILRQVEGYAQ